MHRHVPQWTFADRLRKVRTEALMGQREFAEMLGVKPSAYAAWESGRNRPQRPHTIESIARRIELATGVPASWVLGLDDEGPRPTQRLGGAEEGWLPRLDSDQQPSDYWAAAA